MFLPLGNVKILWYNNNHNIMGEKMKFKKLNIAFLTILSLVLFSNSSMFAMKPSGDEKSSDDDLTINIMVPENGFSDSEDDKSLDDKHFKEKSEKHSEHREKCASEEKKRLPMKKA